MACRKFCNALTPSESNLVCTRNGRSKSNRILWVGECGMLDRPVLLRYTGPTDDYPVETGAVRKDFDRDACTECYLGDLALLRPFVKKQGRYADIFIELEGAGRYKLRLIPEGTVEGERTYHYRCGKNGNSASVELE